MELPNLTNKEHHKGFSLIELLVVIAIISVLLAVLYPSLRKVTSFARQTICSSNMRQISLMTEMYVNDNDQNILPSARNSEQQLRYTENEDPYLGGPPWYELLRHIYGLECSSQDAMVLHCPADKRDKGYCSYSANRYMMGFSHPQNSYEGLYPIRKITSLKSRLDSLIMIGERGCTEEGDIGKIDGQWSMAGIGVEKFLGCSDEFSFGSIGFYPGRHSIPKNSSDTPFNTVENLRLPFLLMDGHVEIYKGQTDYTFVENNSDTWEYDSYYVDQPNKGNWPRMNDRQNSASDY